MPINIGLDFGAQARMEEERRRRLQQLHFQLADQALQEKQMAMREQAATSAKREKIHAWQQEQIANGQPADVANKGGMAMADSLGLDRKLVPRWSPTDEDGGYDVGVPGQDPVRMNPRQERLQSAARRAAVIAAASGQSPTEQGLLPSVQQRALTTPAGMDWMNRHGEWAGGMAGRAMANGPLAGPMPTGMAAIATAPGVQTRPLAPSDEFTASVHEMYKAGEEPSDALLLTLLNRGRQMQLANMREAGVNARFAQKLAAKGKGGPGGGGKWKEYDQAGDREADNALQLQRNADSLAAAASAAVLDKDMLGKLTGNRVFKSDDEARKYLVGLAAQQRTEANRSLSRSRQYKAEADKRSGVRVESEGADELSDGEKRQLAAAQSRIKDAATYDAAMNSPALTERVKRRLVKP